MRRLVVNADDLGYDPEIDRGILRAHREGLVTSATAMVLAPFAAAALRDAPATLGVGLHAVLEPGLPPGLVAGELERQLARFQALRGAPPTHLDSHKHAHARPGVLEAVARVAAARGMPVRALDGPMRATLRASGVRCAGAFLGDAGLRPAWTEAALLVALAALADGTTELMAHPGYRPSVARTSFGVEREVELEALCSGAARRLVESAGIRLCSYADLFA
ncbi:MAG: ChbG/HpnK family deacetylase [Anaeromyxobacter sp.]|nr:ChbG/HpnK family deacetylase [Anaeromyxobacter sp.]